MVVMIMVSPLSAVIAMTFASSYSYPHMRYHRPPPPPLLRPPPQEPDDEPLLPLLAAFARVLRSVIVRMTTVLRATAMRRKSSTKGPKHSAWDGL